MRGERRDYQWEKLSAKFRAVCRASNALCHICVRRGDIEHAQIDYSAPKWHPKSFETDHIKSWHTHPHLRYEWSNLAASHSRCNRQRRDEELEEPAAPDDWIKPEW